MDPLPSTSTSAPAPAPRPVKTDDGHFIVRLNVYDVTNTPSEDTNGLVVRINNVTHQLGIGGVFHGGIEVDSVEWSYGHCDSGSGVYSCVPTKNPMYQLRSTVELGHTTLTKSQIRDVLNKMRKEWPGCSYTLLSRNCCHFCDALALELGAKPIPSWLNRFAQSADATITFTNEAMEMARSVGSSMSRTASWFQESVTRMWTGSSQQGWSRGERHDCLPSLPGYTSSSSQDPSHRPQSGGFLARYAVFPPQSSPSEEQLEPDGADVRGSREAGSGCERAAPSARKAPVPAVMSWGQGDPPTSPPSSASMCAASPSFQSASSNSNSNSNPGAAPAGRVTMSAQVLAQSVAAAASARAAAAAAASAAAAAAHQTPALAPHLLDS